MSERPMIIRVGAKLRPTRNDGWIVSIPEDYTNVPHEYSFSNEADMLAFLQELIKMEREMLASNLPQDGKPLPDSPTDETIAKAVESTEAMIDGVADRMSEMASEPQWMINDRERDTMVENGLHNMNKPLEYGEVAVACDDPTNGQATD